MSKALDTSEMVKDLTPTAQLAKEAQMPMSKKPKSNANKGIMISDNPSGPPLKDVSCPYFSYLAASLFLGFFYLLLVHFFSFYHASADNAGNA